MRPVAMACRHLDTTPPLWPKPERVAGDTTPAAPRDDDDELQTKVDQLEAILNATVPIECLEIALAVDPGGVAGAFDDDDGMRIIAPMPEKLRTLADAFEAELSSPRCLT